MLIKQSEPDSIMIHSQSQWYLLNYTEHMKQEPFCSVCSVKPPLSDVVLNQWLRVTE